MVTCRIAVAGHRIGRIGLHLYFLVVYLVLEQNIPGLLTRKLLPVGMYHIPMAVEKQTH
jgi:hypothetical protein